MENDQPIATRPISKNEELLRQKFYESITAQSDLMDKLAEKLLTLELAVPGLYAAALKLVAGQNATLSLNTAFFITFTCWTIALVLTFIALIPRKWNVDTSIIKQDPQKYSESIGMEDYFNLTAAYKRALLIISSIIFFAGICSAVFTR